ncbi:MAG: hypothetical protein Q8O89_00385 [Nanoarchaeota archaeon]|nr:hypothetical protein [Nanoarchaeota archaeon]
MAITIDEVFTGPASRDFDNQNRKDVASLEGKYFLFGYSCRGLPHSVVLMKVSNGSLVSEQMLPEEDFEEHLKDYGITEVFTLKGRRFNDPEEVLGLKLHPIVAGTTAHYAGIVDSLYLNVVLKDAGVKVNVIDCSNL